MLETPTSLNAADFRQRYTAGYGFLVGNRGKTLVYLQNITRDGRLVFHDEDGLEYFCNLDSGVMFEFLPSVKGWFDCGDSPVMLCRIPARQYNRGINEQNTACLIPSNGGTLSVGVTFKALSGIFSSYKVLVLESWAEFKTCKKDYVVLSRPFLLTKDHVYFYNENIGTVVRETEKVTISLDSNLVRQELTDTLLRNSLQDWEIKCN